MQELGFMYVKNEYLSNVFMWRDKGSFLVDGALGQGLQILEGKPTLIPLSKGRTEAGSSHLNC